MRRAAAILTAGAALSVSLVLLPTGAAARPGAASLMVGVGRADITPITGGYKGGWACTCAKAIGQQERLYARVIVLERGHQKVALVAEDLFALSAGMVRDAATLLPGLGFSEENIIDSATHTHSSQSGYMNHSGDNLILPSNGNPSLSGVTSMAADPVMYSFMTRQLALAIRRANRDLRPGSAGWGQSQLLGVTQNRSLGAHLANYGLNDGPNGGTVNQDPGGYADTIDPRVNVLRVDQRRKGRRVPVGIFSTFANHGTIDHENFWYYSGDHQGAAERVVEAGIRSAGRVPAGQDVVNAFANSDAGDMTSGISYVGPAAAEYIGRREAAAMLDAWQRAGREMSSRPALDLRWTRECFCGQQTSGGQTDSTPWVGKAAAPAQRRDARSSTTTGSPTRATSCRSTTGPRATRSSRSTRAAAYLKAAPFTVCASVTG